MNKNSFKIQKNTLRDLTGNEVAQVAGGTGAPPSTFPGTDPSITSGGPTITTSFPSGPTSGITGTTNPVTTTAPTTRPPSFNTIN